MTGPVATAAAATTSLRIVRLYHSAVVAAFRQRDREMRTLGVHGALVAPRSWNEGGVDVHLEDHGDRFVTPVPTVGRHPYRFWFRPLALFRILRRTAREQIDLLDIHEEPAALATAQIRLTARLAGIRAPFVLYSAQNIEKRFPPPFRWFERSALRHAAGAYVCNEEAGRILRRKGFAGVLEVLPLGVDVERFAPAPDRPAAPELRIGYVGRLEEHKGVHVLIEAVRAVPRATLEIVGDGPHRPVLDDLIGRWGLAGRVRISGFAAHGALPERYRTFDVVVVPSLERSNWIEQFGRVAVEAMASGVPVVATATGSLPEVVGDAGLLVPPEDPMALAAAIERLSADPSLRDELGRRGREASARFSWSRVAADHVALYRRVLS